MLGSFKGTEINGKMYKITLSPDTKVKIQAFGFDDDALSINVLKKMIINWNMQAYKTIIWKI